MNKADTDWRARLEAIADETGYHEPLGADHEVLFHDDSPVLIVSFETRAQIEADREEALPFGYKIARDEGWSALSVIASDESWFRDPAIYAYFDRLVDEAFFEDFDRVVFYGAGPGGYAAAAFSVAAPGATVVALAPQATLDPTLAGWDDRFPQTRRMSFTDRYGFAPEMLDGVERAFVFYDPFERLDAMHAALFARPCVTLMPCRHIGPDPAAGLLDMDILDEILIAAGAGKLTPSLFWTFFRARRLSKRYVIRLVDHLRRARRPVLEAILCRAVGTSQNRPKFRNRYEALAQKLAEQGVELPEPQERAGAA
ncbi:hypothetical protein [Thioclava sp. F28-4]|uniref:hypothetical protein n=1 Tax=Thioclava sp. F28-4 TaxID=1915315 RepID=UPI0009986171|nr:hypothetical protein [Thioclava sp. F28-4]OOY05255.1 hypothetical protein BMI87_09650 [Thioclava sp. F28-4]